MCVPTTRCRESRLRIAAEQWGENMPNDIDEGLIEATIRRVAESKAARTDGPSIEMPVAESIAPVIARPNAQDAGGEPVSILARPAESGLLPQLKADEEDTEVAPQSLRARMQGLPAVPMKMAAWRGAPNTVSPQGAESRTSPKPALPQRSPPRHRRATFEAPAEAEGDIAVQLETIVRRLDAILPMLERIAGSREAGTACGEWERAPQSSRAPFAIRATPRADGVAQVAEPAASEWQPLQEPAPPLGEPKHGFDLLPRNYRITVEDKRGGVDLVPLHRAMLNMNGVRDMSLLSYNNGVAIVALEMTDELDPELLRSSVSRAMSCEARVEVHNENTMVVKVSEE